MRKVFAFALVATMFTFASCGEKKTETTETTTTEAMAEGDAMVDSAAAMVDSASAMVDTASAMVDTAAAAH